jgi:hypothetical protein
VRLRGGILSTRSGMRRGRRHESGVQALLRATWGSSLGDLARKPGRHLFSAPIAFGDAQ